MDTIILPETQKRWINLPLPPKIKRKEERSTSRQNKKESGILTNNSNIVLSSEKRSMVVPRSRSRNHSR